MRFQAEVCEAPIIGDSEYDGGGAAMQLRERGLFLCSTRVSLEHPFYNTDEGRRAFKSLQALPDGVHSAQDGKVMVTVSISLPDKFESMMEREDDRYERLSGTEPSSKD